MSKMLIPSAMTALAAALWSPDGDVSLVDSGGNCTAMGINTARWMVGQCSMRAVQWRQPASGPRCDLPMSSRAFVWDDGAITPLGASRWSSGRAINNHGWVVGMDDDGPWVWVDGTTVALPVLPGATSCDVADLNDAGHIVSGCVAGAQRAVMWTIRVEQGS